MCCEEECCEEEGDGEGVFHVAVVRAVFIKVVLARKRKIYIKESIIYTLHDRVGREY